MSNIMTKLKNDDRDDSASMRSKEDGFIVDEDLRAGQVEAWDNDLHHDEALGDA